MTKQDANAITERAKAQRLAALAEWVTVASEAERLGHASHVRDLSPMHDATTRSIKIRTGKLARFIGVDLGYIAMQVIAQETK